MLDHGDLLQLIDSDDEEAELLKELEAPPKRKELEAPPKRKEIEAPPKRKEIEAPPKRKEIEAPPPKKKEPEAPPPPPPKKNEPSPKNTISTAGLDLDNTKTETAVDTLTKLVAHTLATKTRLKDVPISLDNLSESIVDVLKDMSTADLLAHINDEELGITLPKESGVKPSRRKTNNRSGKELREKLAAKHSANKLAKEKEAALASYSSATDTTGSGSVTAQSRKKKIKKKPPKKSENQAAALEEESQSTELTERAPDPGHVADETPISMNGHELSAAKTPESAPEPEPVRDIDDIDDIDIGVSEDLLKGGGVAGGATSGGHTSSTVTTTTTSGNDSVPAKTSSQSKVVAAREKFRFCENCGSEIEDKILVCSSCKKVAYCNRQCQKAHWKAHKKTCSHKGTKEDCTG